MSHTVSQRTQQLDVAYAALGKLISESFGSSGTDFHVLSAARILVHAAYLESVSEDRDSARP